MSDVFTHPWLSGLFADPEVAAAWSAETQLNHMLAFEVAWSRAGHLAGLWSKQDGAAAAAAIADTKLAPQDLRDGTAQDGVCVPALVRQLREVTGCAAIHTGTTSQDVMDTATVLSLVATVEIFEDRLGKLTSQLGALERKYGARHLMGRTRMQAALPITVAHRLQSWRQPLERHVARLADLKPQISAVQIGGATGDRAALGEDARKMCAAVAGELGLRATPSSWHTARDGLAEAASVFSLITGSIGKIGQDMTLMAQQGVDEITLAGGGGSSAMPHKQNPVLAELLVTLARFNAVQLSGMHHSLLHEQERSGAAWMLEWMILPPLAQTTGRALSAGNELLSQVVEMGKA